MALFIIEMISRAAKTQSWLKLTVQGIVSFGFAIGYVTLIKPHWLTALGLIALGAARSKINQSKSIYLKSNPMIFRTFS